MNNDDLGKELLKDNFPSSSKTTRNEPTKKKKEANI